MLRTRLRLCLAALAGCLLAAATYFPVFKGLMHAANPALEQAVASAPATVKADRSRCALQFDPVGKKTFKQSCDIITSALAKKGTRLAPISIYRALDALLEAGVVHRLESKNAYFASRALHQPKTDRRPMFLACESCGQVIQTDGEDIFAAIDTAAHGIKFQPRVKFVEVSGTCEDCAKDK